MSVCVLCLALAGVAHGKPDKAAREAYKRATAHFSLGRFSEAAAEYLALYEKHPNQTALLFNVAQSYRLAGEPQKALDFYKRYVEATPKGANRADADARIAELEKTVAELEKPKPVEVAPTAPSPSPEPVQAQVQVQPPPAPPAKHDKPVYKKWWLWTVVGVVVVAAVVVPTAVVLSEKSASFHTNAPDFGPGASASGLTVRW